GIGRGHLTRLAADPNPDEVTVTLVDALPAGAFDLQRHMVLRRWDGEGFASATFDEIATPGMNLGDGVHIQFAGNDLRIGDYWQFVTRVIDGSVEKLLNAPPKGIVRHRCPLAIVNWTANTGGGGGFNANAVDLAPGTIVADKEINAKAAVIFDSGTASAAPFTSSILSDCRPKIPLLTRMLQLHYV